MKADDSVQDLISEDNPSLMFIPGLEKSFTIKHWDKKQNAAQNKKKNKNKQHRKKHAKRKFKEPFAKKNEDSQVSIETKLFYHQKWKVPWNIKTLCWESQMVLGMMKS